MGVFIRIAIAVRMESITNSQTIVKNVKIPRESIQIANVKMKQPNTTLIAMNANIVQIIAPVLFQIVNAISGQVSILSAYFCGMWLCTDFHRFWIEYHVYENNCVERTCPYDSTGDYPNCECTEGGFFQDNYCKRCPWQSIGAYPDCVCNGSSIYNKTENFCNSCPEER